MRTTGVYYLPIQSDWLIMGKDDRGSKPILMEGKAAPELLPMIEDGITYLVSLGISYSDI